LRQLRSDKRFSLYLCTLKPAFIAGPFLPWYVLPYMWVKWDDGVVERINLIVRVVAVVVASAYAVFQIQLEHRRFIRLVRKWDHDKPNKAPEPTPGTVTPRAIEGASK
jgi:hypothetical protein